LGFTIEEIRSRCVRGEPYVEHGELTGIGPMQELFVRLEFDAEFRQELGERWRSLTSARKARENRLHWRRRAGRWWRWPGLCSANHRRLPTPPLWSSLPQTRPPPGSLA
jgi:hypothetical protein